jgi:hypothetical protein
LTSGALFPEAKTLLEERTGGGDVQFLASDIKRRIADLKYITIVKTR